MDSQQIALITLVIGVAIVAAVGVHAAFRRLGIPELVGYLALGFVLRALDDSFAFLGESGIMALDILGQLGVVVLLFRVGLDSDLSKLLRELKPATVVWASNLIMSALAGYAVARLVGLGTLASLAVATSLTATSVAVPAYVWREEGALDSEEGELFLDVAELDDISAVVLMGLLFAILPTWEAGGDILPLAASAAAGFAVKLALFLGACLLFSMYVEERMTKTVERLATPPHPMLVLAGLAITIAALAALLGFSVAIGAFFAGLAFSRDPEAVRMESSFEALYALFSPFFFIAIGFRLSPEGLAEGTILGAPLLLAAVFGKVVGVLAPLAFIVVGWRRGLLVAVSMVPRAEVALVVAQGAHREGALSNAVLAALVWVSAGTCLVTPMAIRLMLRRRRPGPCDASRHA